MHAEIETAQPHEIRHRDFVDGGAVVPLLICNDIIADWRIEPGATGRNLCRENCDAILDQRGMLRSERNFDSQLVRVGSAAEQRLERLPIL